DRRATRRAAPCSVHASLGDAQRPSAPIPEVRAIDAILASREMHPCRRSSTANGQGNLHAACAWYRLNTTILRGGSRDRRRQSPAVLALQLAPLPDAAPRLPP